MEENELSNVQLIIRALMSGKAMGSKEISEHLTEMLGKEVKVQDVASMLSRISNPEKCNLGYFISKTPKGNSFLYVMVDEFKSIPEDKAYGLTLKTGKDKYSLEQALDEYPEIGKYVTKPRPRLRRGGKKRPTRGRPPLNKTKVRAKKMVKVKDPVRGKRGRKKKTDVAAAAPKIVSGAEGNVKLEKLAETIREIATLNNLNIHVKVSFSLEK